MTPILSIMVASIPKRIKMADLLCMRVGIQINQLHAVHPTLGEVELIGDYRESFIDGGPSIGKKRESLVDRATGKYLCFLDDDEDVSPNYVETLVRLCQLDADVVTFRSFIKNDFYWGLVDMSLTHTTNEEATPERIIKRLPWHICPVKSKYAKMYKFDDSNYSEDWTWMEKVLKHCNSEMHTDQILHSYQHSSKTSEADRITKYEHEKGQ